MVGRQAGRQAGRLVGWLVNWLIGWFCLPHVCCWYGSCLLLFASCLLAIDC